MTKKQSNTTTTQADKQKKLSKKRPETKSVADKGPLESTGASEPLDSSRLEDIENAEIIEEQLGGAPIFEPNTSKEKASAIFSRAKRVNFITLFLGGISLLIIGFGIAAGVNYVGFLNLQAASQEEQTDLRLAVARQTTLISELEQKLSNVRTELVILNGSIETLNPSMKLQLLDDEISEAFREIEQINSRLFELSERTDVLEVRPMKDMASEEIVEQHSKELKVLKDALLDQQENMQKITDEAEKKENLAKEASQEAQLFLVISGLSVAIENGHSYTAELADLIAVSNAEIPEFLHVSAETGLTTNTELREQFPIAARRALSSARLEGQESQGGTFIDYLKTQLNARSVTPREGMSTDAILSRAEAAIEDGRLAEALAELRSLDPNALTQMSVWIEKAEARLEAVAYIDTIMAQREK